MSNQLLIAELYTQAIMACGIERPALGSLLLKASDVIVELERELDDLKQQYRALLEGNAKVENENATLRAKLIQAQEQITTLNMTREEAYLNNNALRAEVERLTIALTPRLWNEKLSDLWHDKIPDLHAAFQAIRDHKKESTNDQ